MIYGINFNGSPIPESVARVFAQRLDSQGRRVKFDRSCKYTLQGVCNTTEEMNTMVIQADNGHRPIKTVGPRKVKTEIWYAIYR